MAKLRRRGLLLPRLRTRLRQPRWSLRGRQHRHLRKRWLVDDPAGWHWRLWCGGAALSHSTEVQLSDRARRRCCGGQRALHRTADCSAEHLDWRSGSDADHRGADGRLGVHGGDLFRRCRAAEVVWLGPGLSELQRDVVADFRSGDVLGLGCERHLHSLLGERYPVRSWVHRSLHGHGNHRELSIDRLVGALRYVHHHAVRGGQADGDGRHIYGCDEHGAGH